MKKEDLRIGNFVLDIDGDATTIMELRDEFCWLKNDAKCFYKNINPIPLTEEWLLKFGFIQSKGKYGNDFDIVSADRLTIMFTVEHWTDVAEKSNWKNHWHVKQLVNGNKMKYVHQIQNLFYALTGEELNLKKQ